MEGARCRAASSAASAWALVVVLSSALRVVAAVGLDCPAGHKMCVTKKISVRGNNTFPTDATHCVAPAFFCDGYPDCFDGSDEAGCQGLCKGGARACKGGRCIRDVFWCDGVPDCEGGDDEQYCDAKPAEAPPVMWECWRPKSAVGPEMRWNAIWCDGRLDCQGSQDELHCERCNGSATACRAKTGRVLCLHANARCDGFRDCPDGSDEAGCPKGLSVLGWVVIAIPVTVLLLLAVAVVAFFVLRSRPHSGDGAQDGKPTTESSLPVAVLRPTAQQRASLLEARAVAWAQEQLDGASRQGRGDIVVVVLGAQRRPPPPGLASLPPPPGPAPLPPPPPPGPAPLPPQLQSASVGVREYDEVSSEYADVVSAYAAVDRRYAKPIKPSLWREMR